MEQGERKLIRNYTLRMPETLAQRLETHARHEGRSLHAEIIYHLERAVPETMVELPARAVPFIGPADERPAERSILTENLLEP